jgi:chromosome segregation ATPase
VVAAQAYDRVASLEREIVSLRTTAVAKDEHILELENVVDGLRTSLHTLTMTHEQCNKRLSSLDAERQELVSKLQSIRDGHT